MQNSKLWYGARKRRYFGMKPRGCEMNLLSLSPIIPSLLSPSAVLGAEEAQSRSGSIHASTDTKQENSHASKQEAQ
jgi:hypothetical protein